MDQEEEARTLKFEETESPSYAEIPDSWAETPLRHVQETWRASISAPTLPPTSRAEDAARLTDLAVFLGTAALSLLAASLLIFLRDDVLHSFVENLKGGRLVLAALFLLPAAFALYEVTVRRGGRGYRSVVYGMTLGLLPFALMMVIGVSEASRVVNVPPTITTDTDLDIIPGTGDRGDETTADQNPGPVRRLFSAPLPFVQNLLSIVTGPAQGGDPAQTATPVRNRMSPLIWQLTATLTPEPGSGQPPPRGFPPYRQGSTPTATSIFYPRPYTATPDLGLVPPTLTPAFPVAPTDTLVPLPTSTLSVVPFPTDTPAPALTDTPAPVPTDTLAVTPVVPLPTDTPVATPVAPLPTDTPVATPVAPAPTSTTAPLPTDTPVPAPTATLKPGAKPTKKP